MAVNARLTSQNGYVFATEHSRLISNLSLIDTVAESDNRILYKVLVQIESSVSISAKIDSYDERNLVITIERRDLPADSEDYTENSFSNTTTNKGSDGVVRFNEDSTPYIIPGEVSVVPRRGLTKAGTPKEKVPVTSGLTQEQLSQSANPELYDNGGGATTPLNTGVQNNAVGIDSVITGLNEVNNNSLIYVDESEEGPYGKIYYENPAILNVSILAPSSKMGSAEKLAIVLNSEKREQLQTKLGLTFRIVNVSILDNVGLSQTTLFYRNKYLKSASVLADEIDGVQKIMKMINDTTKIGVDVEIILAGK